MNRPTAGRQKRPLEHVVGPAPALEKPDLRIIRTVYAANAEFGMPYLPAPRQWKRAAVLAKNGMLKAARMKVWPPSEGCDGYTVTQAGIDAYNAVMRSNA